MRERWDEAINKIDEKYIAEAAQTHAKHAEKQREAEQFEAEGEHPTAITTVRNKKSGKGKIIGFCAAAAAVALVAIGGGVMMGRDDSILTGDTTTEATIEATVETDETSEQIVITEREFTHLDLADYSAYSVSRYNVSVEVTEYMLEGLNEAVSGFAKNEPVDSIARDEAYSAALRLYKSDTVDGHYDQLRLHKTVDAPDSPLYYYSLSDTNITTYFEISEQSYDDMSIWLASYAPDYINAKVLAEDDLGNVTRPEDGIYYVQDSNGGVYSVNLDERFAVGDTLRVWFYGGVMETYPAELNEIKAERIYDIASDDKTLVPEGMELSYDPDVFEEYFLGEWKQVFDTSASYDWTMTFDYNSELADHIACGELSDGYYFFCYNGGEPAFYFIPEGYTDSLFVYYGIDPLTHKRSSNAEEYIFHTEIGNSLSGALNYMGENALLARMGDNFPEIYNSLLEGFTDDDGRQWSFARGYVGTPNDPKVHLKDYSQGGISTYAEIFMEYYDPATFDQANNAETRWYSHFIQKTENHYYELIATLPCDENGNVYPDSEYKSFSEDDLYGHDVTAGFSWAGNYENIVYPQVYVEDTNTRKVLAQTELVNPAMYTHGGGSFYGDMYPIVQDVQLKSGVAFAVMIPVSYNPGPDVAGYCVTFYSYDKINKQISLIGDGFFPYCVNAIITSDDENDIVRVYETDTVLRSYRIDVKNNTVELIESGNEDGTFEFDLNNGGTGKEFEVFHTAFAGEWSSGTENMELDLYSDMFSYSDHAWFYEDNSGYFMMANSRLWFVPMDNRDAMYYYEGLAGSGTLAFDDADKVYSRSGALEGFYGGEGEMGWFGLLDFLYDSGIAVDELFDMEITDENGNVWVRTPDRSIDWGGIYEGYVNGELVYFLKMQSKNFPDTFKYFSFNFNLPKLRNGSLVYSDEHYSFNMGVFDINELATDYAAEAKADSDSIGYGCFIVDTNFYTLDNGGYYAVRMMGNSGAQWLSYGEVFYNSRDFDGAEGYEKVCETNACDCVASGNYLYRLYNEYDEEFNTTLWLIVHDGTEGTAIMVDVDGFVPMDANMELHGNETKWLVVDYYDTDEEEHRYVLYDVTTPETALEAVTGINDIVYHGNGTFTALHTDGRELLYGGAEVTVSTEVNG